MLKQSCFKELTVLAPVLVGIGTSALVSEITHSVTGSEQGTAASKVINIVSAGVGIFAGSFYSIHEFMDKINFNTWSQVFLNPLRTFCPLVVAGAVALLVSEVAHYILGCQKGSTASAGIIFVSIIIGSVVGFYASSSFIPLRILTAKVVWDVFVLNIIANIALKFLGVIRNNNFYFLKGALLGFSAPYSIVFLATLGGGLGGNTSLSLKDNISENSKHVLEQISEVFNAICKKLDVYFLKNSLPTY